MAGINFSGMWPLYNSQSSFSSVQSQSCPTIWDPKDCSSPGLPVHHQLPELAHVHHVGDAIQPSHPLLSPSPPAPNPSQHQGLFKWVILCIKWPKYWTFSFSISPFNEYSGSPLGWTGWISLQSKGLSRVFSNTTVQKHQLFRAQLFYSPTLTSIHDCWRNHSLD